MWLSSRLTLIRNHAGPIVLVGTGASGASRLISQLDDLGPLVWLELDQADAHDPMSAGGKLSDAVKQALGSRLFPRALPYPAAIALLAANLELLGPFTFALSGAEHNAEVAQTFLQLHQHRTRVVLHCASLPEAFKQTLDHEHPRDLLILTDQDLRVTTDEALTIAAGHGAAPELALHCLAVSGGAYETFMLELNRHLGEHIQPIPSPGGPRLPEGGEIAVDPEAVLEVLIKKGDWIRAAEIAVTSVPGRALEVLTEAGHAYHEQGLHTRLWRLLEHLPQDVKQHPEMLFRRLSTAVRLNKTKDLQSEVASHLEQHEAPDLRALYAGVFLDVDEGRKEAKRAFEARATPFTAFHHGHFLADSREGAAVLRKAVKLAECHGRPYEVARNAGTLTARLIDAGEYREAEQWGAWALEHFDKHEVADTQRRLFILNNWAYARILLGETVGLESLLRDGEAHLGQAFPSLLTLFRATLGDYLVASERPAEALAYYRLNWEQAERHMLGIHALNMVQALLSLNPPEVSASHEIATRAFYLTQHEAWDYHYSALLARGMSLTRENPKKASLDLESVLHEKPTTLPAPLRLQASLHLAYAKLELGQLEPTFRWCLDKQVVFLAVWAEEAQDALSLLCEVADVPHPL